ncbi:family 43 glycosylhydrolase [Marinimicrobium sp. LS-A18]|uniref:family 43 glycosylhydrolase n=1 Tax=Marinimicrobium sp. LS-A18 TaxID=1381596 RepID=UPI000465904A|nr:family 43 glycosylhydrolase [Marinimicrobium sp. LS-A18]
MSTKDLPGLIGAAALLLAAGAATTHAAPATDHEWASPEFAEATVHDPSVIKVDDTYYVFGSHLAAAKSDDLMQWQQVADGANAANPLFDDVQTELRETFEWAQTDTLWAADVIQLEDGRFYMYYNASRGDSPRSAMGVAVADEIEGPYRNEGIFLRSGMWGQPSEDGTIYDARIHPNVVDPDAFFDAEGKLWMVYGSYSGGLFIFEMDPETGFPLPGQGYGKHLMGGNHSRIEAPYILYSPETQYYYLFTSFGGLSADGGYNVRVARSRQPDGPYFDAQGNNMAEVKSDPALPLFDDASIEPYAMKILGNHLFTRELGEDGEGLGTGYVSPGHNSAYYDDATGQYFLISHSRFPGTGERHNIRVNELLMNDADWPVAAPYRYADKAPQAQPGQRKVKRPDVVGDYKVILKDKTITADIETSRFATLTNNGRIQGDIEGRWWFGGNDRISVELSDGDYEGVLSYQWNETAERFDLTFSALSDAGLTLWGSRLPDRPTEAVLQAILDDIEFSSIPLQNDIDLPVSATRNATIEWASSAPQWIATDGQVNRPEHGLGDQVVTLRATVHYDGETQSREYPVTVREQAPDGLLAHYSFDGNLNDTTGQQAPGQVSGARIDWAGGQIDFVSGVSAEAAYFDGQSGVRLPGGLIASHRYSVSFWLNPSALNAFSTTFFGARNPDSWISFLPMGHGFVNGHTMLWSGTLWYDAGTGMNIPQDAWSHVAWVVDEGALSIYINGEERFSGAGFPHVFSEGTGIFSLGVNWWDLPYEGAMDELRVYEKPLSAAEVMELSQTP